MNRRRPENGGLPGLKRAQQAQSVVFTLENAYENPAWLRRSSEPTDLRRSASSARSGAACFDLLASRSAESARADGRLLIRVLKTNPFASQS